MIHATFVNSLTIICIYKYKVEMSLRMLDYDYDLQENAGNIATAMFMNVFCVLGVVYFLVWQVRHMICSILCIFIKDVLNSLNDS